MLLRGDFMANKFRNQELREIFQKIDRNEVRDNENMFLTTLYCSEQNGKLSLDNDRFIVSKNDVLLFSIPCMKITQIIIIGNVLLTSQVNNYCLENKIPVIFLGIGGNYKGRMTSDNYADMKNIKAQFDFIADEKNKLRIAKAFVAGKIRNTAKFAKDFFCLDPNELHQYSIDLYKAKNIDAVRGYEGISASFYFREVKNTFEHLGFSKRVKKPPTDMVNSLLSFGYTILYSNVISILQLNSLNPYIGILHEESANHAALASDLLEEFRVFAIDKPVFEALRVNMFTTEDFVISDNGAFYLKQEPRKIFIGLVEKSFSCVYQHQETGFQVTLKRIIDLQAKRLARVIKKQEKDYIPMLF